MRKNVYKSRQTKKPKVLAVNKSSQKMMVRCESAVNKDAVRREVIDGVEHVIISSYTMPDNIVMNGILYPAEEIEASFHTLERTLAPIEHPIDAEGNFLSANDPLAIHNFHAGAFNVNVNRVDGRLHIEKHVNVVEAMKSEKGKRLLERIEELETNSSPRPIHTSTGVMLVIEDTKGPQKEFNGIATNAEFGGIAREMTFDHDAILLDSIGAAQPHQGVGMAVNADGDKFKSEHYFNADIETTPTPSGEELSHDEIRTLLNDALNKPPYSGGWVQEVYADTFIFEVSDQLFSVPYKIVNGTAQIVGIALTVERDVTYNPKTNKDLGMTSRYLKSLGVTVNGALSSRLTSLIDKKAKDDADRSNILDSMASAAGIKRDTLLKILSGEIETPPDGRLEGFATVLGVSLESLKNLISNNENGDAMFKDLIVNALKAAKIEIEGLDDAALLAKYNELQTEQGVEDNSESNDEGANLAAVVANALKPVVESVQALEAKVNAKSDDELSALAKAVGDSELYPNMSAEVAKLIPIDALKTMAANCQTSTGIDGFQTNAGSGNAVYSNYDMPA